MVPQSILTQALVFSICREYKITSADIFCKCDATIDQLIDVIEGNRRYIPCVYVLNKIDQLTIEELDIIDQLPHHVPISAAQEWNLDELMESIWEYTRMIRIYTKVSTVLSFLSITRILDFPFISPVRFSWFSFLPSITTIVIFNNLNYFSLNWSYCYNSIIAKRNDDWLFSTSCSSW